MYHWSTFVWECSGLNVLGPAKITLVPVSYSWLGLQFVLNWKSNKYCSFLFCCFWLIVCNKCQLLGWLTGNYATAVFCWMAKNLHRFSSIFIRHLSWTYERKIVEICEIPLTDFHKLYSCKKFHSFQCLIFAVVHKGRNFQTSRLMFWSLGNSFPIHIWFMSSFFSEPIAV